MIRIPLLALLLPLVAATALHSAPDSAPLPAPALPPAGRALAELNQRAQKEFLQGTAALGVAKYDEARAAYDNAADFYLNAPEAVRADPAFSAWYRDLAERIADLEIPAAAADSEAQPETPEPELTPGELALESPILLSPEELIRLKALIASAPASKTPDVPITINDDVLAFLKFYQGRGRQVMEDGINRAGRYLTMMRREFAAAGLPQDLVWMALVESNFKTSAYSRAHARGIWQFIPSTGRTYGLKAEYWVDERADPEKSVKAAVRFLKDLHDDFGDWHSAMAAYNSGPGHVNKARRRTGTTDFFKYYKSRYIPRETRGYVPIIMAAIIIAKDPERFGFTHLDPDPPLKTDTVSVIGPVRLASAAEAFNLPVETLELLNPELIRKAVPSGGYLLRVPEGSGAGLEKAAKALPVEEIPIEVDAFSGWNRSHRVRRGQTLASIARRYHVSRVMLAQANGLSPGARLHAGVRLRVPGRAGKPPRGGESVKMKLGQKANHRVRSGDTLYSIARRYHTTTAALQKWNHLTGNNVPVGRSLVVYYGLGE